MKNVLIITGVLVFAVFCAWQIFVTEDLIEWFRPYIQSRYGYSLEVQGFKRGLFFTASADKAILRKDRRNVAAYAPQELIFDLVKARIGFWPVEIHVQAQMFGGEVKAQCGADRKLRAEVRNADLGLIGEAFGFETAGRLGADIDGDQVKFQIHHFLIKNAGLAAGYLPLDSFPEVKGLLMISRREVLIRSLLMEGPYGYANVKGNISKGYFEGVAEFTPSSEKDTGSLPAAYRTGQGNYAFPFKINF